MTGRGGTFIGHHRLTCIISPLNPFSAVFNMSTVTCDTSTVSSGVPVRSSVSYSANKGNTTRRLRTPVCTLAENSSRYDSTVHGPNLCLTKRLPCTPLTPAKQIVKSCLVGETLIVVVNGNPKPDVEICGGAQVSDWMSQTVTTSLSNVRYLEISLHRLTARPNPKHQNARSHWIQRAPVADLSQCQ